MISQNEPEALAKASRRIIVFDLEIEGHHAGYIEHLANYWCQTDQPGHLDIVVSPLFLSEHANVTGAILNYSHCRLQFVPIKPDEYAELTKQQPVFWRYLKQWRLFCKYADVLGADHGLIMYFDFFQLPSILGGPSPCPFSGIYFRPTFHYHNFANYPVTFKERIKAFRKKFLLARVLRNPSLKVLYCLDPFAAVYIQRLFETEAEIVHLPDPVKIYSNVETRVQQLRPSLNIEVNRKVFLLFGTLVKRKGIYQLFEAISLLPPHICQNLCVLLAGQADPAEQRHIQAQVAELCQSLPVQIIAITHFIVDQDIQAYFHLADVILAPYQNHMGMSAILVRAAAAQKPVLASNYGVMGEIVRQYNLGLTIDSTSPSILAQAIHTFLEVDPQTMLDPTKAQKFADQNSVEKFTQTLFTYL